MVNFMQRMISVGALPIYQRMVLLVAVLLVVVVHGLGSVIGQDLPEDEALRGCTTEEVQAVVGLLAEADLIEDIDAANALLMDMGGGDVESVLLAWVDLRTEYLIEIEPKLADCNSIQQFNRLTIRYISNTLANLAIVMYGFEVGDSDEWTAAIELIIEQTEYYSTSFIFQVALLQLQSGMELADN